MALTEYGKAVRSARVRAETTLAQMALELQTTPAFLSAMETGRKKVPGAWVEKVDCFFARKGINMKDLAQLADVSNRSVNLDGLSPAHQMAIAGFARTTPDQAQLARFQELLRSLK